MKKAATAPKTRTIPVPSERTALAEAIRRRDGAIVAFKKAEATITRARQAVKNAETKLASFGNVEQQITAARAEMVKDGKTGPLPAKLLARRNARQIAREHLEEYQSALASLFETDYAPAKQSLDKAIESVAFEAFKVLLLEAQKQSDALREVMRHVWDLSDCLRGLDSAKDTFKGLLLRPDSPPELVQAFSNFTQLFEPLVTEPPVDFKQDPVKFADMRWRELFTALQTDPITPAPWTE